MSNLAEIAAVVLNVEDDDAARYARTRRLQATGWRVVEAASGSEALALAAEVSPDLVVLDVRLPDINGIDVCRLLKANPATADAMVLQVSAVHVAGSDRVRGLDGGADGYLAQPFDHELLVATCQALLRRRRAELANRGVAREMVEALQQADRSKDELLAIVAHELRNPLGALTNALAILGRSTTLGPRDQDALAVAQRQRSQLARLVDDLLDVTRLSRGTVSLRRAVVDVRTLIRDAADTLQPTLQSRSQRLVVDLPEDDIEIEGDASRLAQVLENLLTNASKFSPQGGIVTLRVQVEDAHVRIAVIDHGRGISAEDVPRLFRLFEKLDARDNRDSPSGLGIGLAVVKRLVELHDGTIDVHSQGPGAGATFSVRLPRL